MAEWNGMNWIRKDKRLAIYLRDGMACAYCGAGVEDEGVILSLDHIVPRSAGGGNAASNLVTSCKSCNSARGDIEIDAWCETVTVDAEEAQALRAYIARQAKRKLERELAKQFIARRNSWQGACSAAAGA